MGQDQSYVAHGGVAQVRRHKDDYEESAHRSSGSADRDRERDGDLRRHRARRSADSFKSDNSGESGGYRSGSSGYRSGSSGSSGFRSDGSACSEHYCPPLYKNDHYRDVGKELYRPVKIAKDRRHKLQLFDDGEKGRLAGYLSEEGKAKPINAATTPKRAGIRNYTPKILSEGEQKRIESWI